MSKIRVSAVSYTNTKPFIYGLEHSSIGNQINLSLDIPSVCASKLINDEADIGLVPVAALGCIPTYTIISDYCIGANGAVNSVFIFSSKPIQSIQTLALDLQSRTSNALAKILLKHFWKVDPKLVTADADAFVEIGDRTFGKTDKYPFVYDLSEAWKEFTGLPFVFAVWASNKSIDKAFLQDFNKALKHGVDNISNVIEEIPAIDNFDVKDYLTVRLDYKLTKDKLEALELFQSYLVEWKDI